MNRYIAEIERLQNRIRELEQKQKWIDEVIRPDHPDDERPWASAYITCRQRIKELEDGIRKHKESTTILDFQGEAIVRYFEGEAIGIDLDQIDGELYKLLEGK